MHTFKYTEEGVVTPPLSIQVDQRGRSCACDYWVYGSSTPLKALVHISK